MALDILAFTLATLLLTAIVAMLAIGLADLLEPPTSTWCRRCLRWTIDNHHHSERVCPRCRTARRKARRPVPGTTPAGRGAALRTGPSAQRSS